jgi:hypothetical protein
MSKKKINSSLETEISKRVEKVKEKQLKDELESKLNVIVNQNLIKELIEKKIPSFNQKSKTPVQFRNPKPIGEEKILCVTMSDIHIGKSIPGYDFPIFKNKLANLFWKIKELIQDKSPSKLIIFLIGDVTDGDDIYPGHSNFICMKVAEQSIEGAKCLSDFLVDLHDLLPNIEVNCIPGNHGRDGRKGMKTLKDNWDYVLYQIMKVHLKNISTIKFNISEDWKMFVKVGDLTFMAFHGDDTVNGQPLVNLPKAIAAWGDMFRNVQEFDASVCGHWHLPTMGIHVNGREVFINGSFSPGLNEDFTEKKIRQLSTTAQISWIVKGNRILDRNLLEI